MVSPYDGAMSEQPMNVAALLAQARTQLDASEAEVLLCHALERSRSWLFAHGDAVPDSTSRRWFDALVARRVVGEPVAYLTGRRGFWTLDLAVTPDTLIPRPETECVVELALERIASSASVAIADLGTGSGALALAIAASRPRTRVLATDRSVTALAVARLNAGALAIANVEFREGDWFEPLAGMRFAMVVANPPYIADSDPHLSQGDLRHEPLSALASGRDGLDDIRRIVADAPAHLEPGGWLLLEHGFDQGPAVRGLLAAAGFIEVATALDLGGRDRVGLGRLRAAG